MRAREKKNQKIRTFVSFRVTPKLAKNKICFLEHKNSWIWKKFYLRKTGFVWEKIEIFKITTSFLGRGQWKFDIIRYEGGRGQKTREKITTSFMDGPQLRIAKKTRNMFVFLFLVTDWYNECKCKKLNSDSQSWWKTELLKIVLLGKALNLMQNFHMT